MIMMLTKIITPIANSNNNISDSINSYYFNDDSVHGTNDDNNDNESSDKDNNLKK